MRRGIQVQAAALLAATAFLGCGGDSPRTIEGDKAEALATTKTFIQNSLNDLVAAAVALQAAAPAVQADGWNATRDAAAIAAMKVQWKKARTSYEHIEGAIAVLFPELDVSTDERYDGFLSDFGPDNDLFDGQGVTGIHAIERILYSDVIPQRVIDFESKLDGYQPAAFPKNADQATRFKTQLCQKLVDDLKNMSGQFKPLALDPSAAWRGVIGSMQEQVEKADKAATGEEESRYAQYTLADMRANVEAGVNTFNAFHNWLIDSGGAALDAQISAGFTALKARYAAVNGDALPPVPATWSSSNPSQADLQTPFGVLFTALSQEADDTRSGSLVNAMDAAATLLQIQ